MSETVRSTRITRKRLELFLQKLEKPKEYDIRKEQYVTDPATASHILFLALSNGDIAGKKVADLGAGSGVFACGAAMLGADSVLAVEIDSGMAELLRRNSRDLPVTVLNSSVDEFSESVDTVIMNPPFGSVEPGADRIFLEKAVQLSKMIYSIHNMKSVQWIEKYYSSNADIVSKISLKLAIPHIYPHHTSRSKDIDAVAFVVKTRH